MVELEVQSRSLTWATVSEMSTCLHAYLSLNALRYAFNNECGTGANVGDVLNSALVVCVVLLQRVEC